MTAQREERRLAAILCADVVGYSRLMGADESGTLAQLKTHRKELIEPKIAEHAGRIVKTTGDGLLVEFGSVVDAVRCAAEAQRAMAGRNENVPQDRRVEYRIGINLGDVIIEGDDIYGDGVNVAARLEGLAEPGGICISRSARDQVRDKLPLDLEDLGEQEVKNIARPVRVFRVVTAPGAAKKVTSKARKASRTWRLAAVGAAIVVVVVVAGSLAWLRPWEATLERVSEADMAFPLPDKPSIAVLPFDNLSGDPEQEYFADGITEDIITALSKFEGLFVIARNSVYTYKGRPVRVQQVSEELGVRYVLEGSVRRSGDQVRITAQLVDATVGHHLWAERFDRVLNDVFALQDEVTQKIVAALAVEVSAAEAKRVSRKDTDNFAAYDYVLRGQEYLFRFTKETHAAGRAMFEKAIDLDPNYARAYSQLAWSHLNDWQFGWSESRQESLERAFELAQKAVILDDSDPQAHGALGEIYLWKKDYERAVAESENAIALNPNNADRHVGLADTLIWVGRPEEAVAHVEEATRLNPSYPFNYSWVLGHAYFVMERYEEAVSALNKVRDRNPNFWPAHIYLSASYGQLGRVEEGRAELAAANKLYDISGERAREYVPYKDPADLARLFDGLRKVGAADSAAIKEDCLALITEVDSGYEVQGAIEVDAAEAKRLFDRGVRFVDARGDRAWRDGHIPGAVHLGLEPATAVLNEATLSQVVAKDKEVVFYCGDRSCYLSPCACAKALTWGFTKVYYFADGFPGWSAADYAVAVP